MGGSRTARPGRGRQKKQLTTRHRQRPALSGSLPSLSREPLKNPKLRKGVALGSSDVQDGVQNLNFLQSPKRETRARRGVGPATWTRRGEVTPGCLAGLLNHTPRSLHNPSKDHVYQSRRPYFPSFPSSLPSSEPPSATTVPSSSLASASFSFSPTISSITSPSAPHLLIRSPYRIVTSTSANPIQTKMAAKVFVHPTPIFCYMGPKGKIVV